jgi:hypothetical protein
LDATRDSGVGAAFVGSIFAGGGACSIFCNCRFTSSLIDDRGAGVRAGEADGVVCCIAVGVDSSGTAKFFNIFSISV